MFFFENKTFRGLCRFAAVFAVVAIEPVSPVFVVTKPVAVSSVTVYVTSVGRPVALLLSPSFSVNVATPFVNVMPPYVPLIVVSPSVTVKLKSFVLSAAASLTTVLLTFRSPFSRVFVNAAVAAVVAIDPVSPV